MSDRKRKKDETEQGKTKEDEVKQRISELEHDIEEVLGLLSTQKSKKEHWSHLVQKRIATFSSVEDKKKDRVFLKHKTHKNLVVTQHVQDKMDLIKLYKEYHKYEKYSDDLMNDLEDMTKELCKLLSQSRE